MRRPMIAGNWKMYKDISQASYLAKRISELTEGLSKAEVVICPPFTAIKTVSDILSAPSVKISLGAQNVYFEEEGAFTGEISPLMLKDLGVKYCIVGHSERRQLFGETDEMVNKKAKALLKAGILPIFCVGESEEQHKASLTNQVISEQVKRGLEGIYPDEIGMMVIAYEPIWAIGTGLTATSDQAEAVIKMIRGEVEAAFGKESSEAVRILYGGSVKPENIAELMAKDNIDGALVGGASLKAESFTSIIAFDEG